MKRFKLTAVLLSLSMALTFMPATVYAEADTADTGGADVTENEVYEDAAAPQADGISAIEYAALAYPELNVGESQGLVIGMDAPCLTGAKITLVSKSTGASSEYDAELINEEADKRDKHRNGKHNRTRSFGLLSKDENTDQKQREKQRKHGEIDGIKRGTDQFLVHQIPPRKLSFGPR